MKKFAFIAAVVFTTISLESCRQPDEFMSNEEAATLKKVQDSSHSTFGKGTENTNSEQSTTATLVDGEIIPPPRK